MDKPLPPFVKSELDKGELVQWSGQPELKKVFLAAAPVSVFFFGFAACYALAHPLNIQLNQPITIIFTLIENWPLFPLGAFVVLPLFMTYAASQAYFLVTNQRILTIQNYRGKTVTEIKRDDASADERFSLTGAKNLVWLRGQKTSADLWTRTPGVTSFDAIAPDERRIVITNYRLFQTSSDEVLAKGIWNPARGMLDILFVDQLSVTRGSTKNVDYLDFKSVNLEPMEKDNAV